VLVQEVARCTMLVPWYTLDSADHDSQVFPGSLLRSVADFVAGASGIATRLAEAPLQRLAEQYMSPTAIWCLRRTLCQRCMAQCVWLHSSALQHSIITYCISIATTRSVLLE